MYNEMSSWISEKTGHFGRDVGIERNRTFKYWKQNGYHLTPRVVTGPKILTKFSYKISALLIEFSSRLDGCRVKLKID